MWGRGCQFDDDSGLPRVNEYQARSVSEITPSAQAANTLNSGLSLNCPSLGTAKLENHASPVFYVSLNKRRER
jgi:hypothetical protein